jgi:ABC-type Fe3+/spermidine/putrescine transport system ATPase subunit
MLDVANLSFSYSDKKVIDNISFSAEKGQQVALIGESGCGKSTLLKLVYGLYDAGEGSISWFGNPVLGPKHRLVPGEEYMKYLAQDFGLMPFITAAENVGKYLSNVDKAGKNARVAELLEVVGMSDFADVKPQYLSGGQQQRIAIAKALALEPEILLLDEPFSHIDAFRANTLRRSLFRYFREEQITCIMATHDASDVLSFSDKVLVMKDGKIRADGNPESIYQTPESHYTASLFDDVNEIPESWLHAGRSDVNKILVYPHQLGIASYSPLEVRVKQNYFKGSRYLVEAATAGKSIFFENEVAVEIGSLVFLALKS